MKCLISGGAGFIGSHLTQRCVDLGWTVDVVDNMSGASCVAPGPGVREFVFGDFTNARVISDITRGEYDVVFHLAARPRIGYSVEHPVKTHQNNVERTLRLIDACRLSTKRPRVVFSSSSSVYGDAAMLPVREDHPRRPLSPYALQKAVAEDYLRLYHDLYGLDSVCLRYFTVFGPGQIGGSPYSTAIAAWLTAIGSGQPLRSDGDGMQARDLCYIDNVVDANIAAAEHDGPLGAMPINVACGRTYTNNEILAYLRCRYPGAKIIDAPARKGDVSITHADVTRLLGVLGVSPKVDMWSGLERTITWHELRSDWHPVVTH